MKKTATHVSAAKKRGLLLILALILVVAPQSPAIAQTVKPGELAEFSSVIEALGGAEMSGPIEPPSVQATLLNVCTARGYSEDCAKTLLGMAWKESNFIGTAVGDRGKARGWFQIWPKYHTGTLHDTIKAYHPEIASEVDCAENLACSADWTLTYLERNGYPKNLIWAVQCHNGCGLTGYKYARNAIWHGNNKWNTEVTQVALAK